MCSSLSGPLFSAQPFSSGILFPTVMSLSATCGCCLLSFFCALPRGAWLWLLSSAIPPLLSLLQLTQARIPVTPLLHPVTPSPGHLSCSTPSSLLLSLIWRVWGEAEPGSRRGLTGPKSRGMIASRGQLAKLLLMAAPEVSGPQGCAAAVCSAGCPSALSEKKMISLFSRQGQTALWFKCWTTITRTSYHSSCKHIHCVTWVKFLIFLCLSCICKTDDNTSFLFFLLSIKLQACKIGNCLLICLDSSQGFTGEPQVWL